MSVLFRKTTLLLMAMLLAELLILSGCQTEPLEVDLPRLEDMNILLIVIDTMGADYAGFMTPGLDTTPHLDALAAEGVVFRRASAPAPWTQPSIASLMTGLTPSKHGTLRLFDRLDPEQQTLAEHLTERGFSTSGVISPRLVAKKFGFHQGFSHYNESSITDPQHSSSKRVTRCALRELRRLRKERFFLYVHYFDPHNDYLHHSDFDRSSNYRGQIRAWDQSINALRQRRHEFVPEDVEFLRNLYQEEIAFTDNQVGVLLDELAALGLRENTLIILTADHGEEFMEHDWLGHTILLYDTLTHVPLVFCLPDRLNPGINNTPVSTLDVAPTLLALSRTPVDCDWDGQSLLPLLAGNKGSAKRRIFSEVAYPLRKEDQGIPELESFQTAVSVGDWKLIHDLKNNHWSLFDRSSDPGEVNNLYTDNHARVRELRPELIEWEKGKVETWERVFGHEDEMSDAERQRLRSLGYIN